MARKKKLPREYFICNLALAPLRIRPDDASEMISQLLFGETGKIIKRKNKSWIKVSGRLDQYEGWLDPKQVYLMTEAEYNTYRDANAVSLDMCQILINEKKSFPILMGSSLPKFDGMSFKMPDGKYIFNGQAITKDSIQLNSDLLIKLAKKYIHAPYLWGGRSPFGIDCSGLTQVVYKSIGVNLPRDAKDQASIGEIVDFVELTKQGDLAFFINGEGRIIHVGIVIQDGEIIHSSGKVRIDKLDHEGIYNRETKKYTHKLKYIRRVVDFAEAKTANV